MARKTKEEALKTYHLLLDSSAELFHQQGISTTTLHDIAKNAGMTRGAIYWHFENKGDVIKALWERDAAPAFNHFIEQLKADVTEDHINYFKTTLKGMFSSVLKDPKASQALRIVLNSSEFTAEQSELQSFLDTKALMFYSAIVTAVKKLDALDLIQKKYDATFLAGALWSYLHGLIHINMRTRVHAFDLTADSDSLIDLFLDGLLVEHSN